MKLAPRFPGTRRGLLLLGLLACACTGALAQSWPDRAIKMVVPFPPGGGADNAARAFAEKLAGALGQPVVIDNKPGASGNIGAETVVRAPADGYTLLFGNEFLATNPVLFKALRYDSLRDFEPVARVASSASAIAVHPSLPVKTLKELSELAATRSLNYASPGMGTGPHLYGQLLALNTRVKFNHVPYRGTAPAVADALGGQVDFVIAPAAPMVAHIKSGKLRALAVTGAERTPLLSEVPTALETGLVSDVYDVWYGVLAPAQTPKAILARLREASAKVLRDPELVDKLTKAGYDVKQVTPEAFRAEIERDMKAWARVVEQAKIELQ